MDKIVGWMFRGSESEKSRGGAASDDDPDVSI